MKQNRVLHLALIVIFASLIFYYFYNNQPRKEKEGMNIFEQGGWEHKMKDGDDKWKKGDDKWKNEDDKKKSVSAPVVTPFASAPVVSPASNENDEYNIKIHNSNNVYMLPKQSVNESKHVISYNNM